MKFTNFRSLEAYFFCFWWCPSQCIWKHSKKWSSVSFRSLEAYRFHVTA